MGAANGRGRPAAQRLMATTRGKMLILLCRGRHTVNDLAGHLRLTDNAVRAQLQRLQRDGLVRQIGWRSGFRKPHAEYEITLKARELFTRLYEPLIQELTDVLGER